MKREDALSLQPGDTVQCVDLLACAYEDDPTLYNWTVESVWRAPEPAAVRVMMACAPGRQLVSHNNIKGKVV